MTIIWVLIFVLYAGIFVFFWRFKRIINIALKMDNSISALFSENSECDIDKRQFLLEKIRYGECISQTAKTPWTEKRLSEASDKVIEKLYDQYENPPPPKVSKQDAHELGKPIVPIVIEMYAQGLKGILKNLPYIGDKYTVNVEKLAARIASNESFCNNLAVKIGSKIIEQMGDKSPMHMGISLASMTWECIEPIDQQKPDDCQVENNIQNG